MENYIIIHGSFSKNTGNWFEWLKEELIQQGKSANNPQMPIGVGVQNFESWSKVFDKLDINENTTIIGHSIAPVFICKYLIKNRINVKKLLLVCGFNNYELDKDYDAVNKPMYLENPSDIKKYCNDIVCFYTDDDPYVKFDVEKDFAEKVSTKQILINGGGHLNAERGYTKFEEILKEI